MDIQAKDNDAAAITSSRCAVMVAPSKQTQVDRARVTQPHDVSFVNRTVIDK